MKSKVNTEEINLTTLADCTPRCATLDEYPYKTSNLGSDDDVSLSLLSLLDVMSCPTSGQFEIARLARNDAQRMEELQALTNLWQSLGRPTSEFWRETRVFCNRILSA